MEYTINNEPEGIAEFDDQWKELITNRPKHNCKVIKVGF